MSDVSEPAPTRLVLARHGETAWSRSGQHTGRTDIPLTDVGREQARRVGAALAGRSFSRVLTSPLSISTSFCRVANKSLCLNISPAWGASRASPK